MHLDILGSNVLEELYEKFCLCKYNFYKYNKSMVELLFPNPEVGIATMSKCPWASYELRVAPDSTSSVGEWRNWVKRFEYLR